VTRLALAVAAVLLVGCGGSDAPPARSDVELRDVSSVLALRTAFNEDRGSPRLLLLLSPT
jgi:hypothetical protein